MTDKLLQQFIELFPGDSNSHTTFKPNGKLSQEGKALGDYKTVRKAASEKDYQNHLDGEVMLTLKPASCVRSVADQYDWSCTDGDDLKPGQYETLVQHIGEQGLPMYSHPSKSNNFHGFVFYASPQSKEAIHLLHRMWNSNLGLPEKTEIFPKKVAAGKLEFGLNLPFFGNPKGFEKFLPLVKRLEVTPELIAQAQASSVQPVRKVSTDQPHALQLRKDVDFAAELTAAGIKYQIRQDGLGTAYDYHNLGDQPCLVAGHVHQGNGNPDNPRCCQFVVGKNNSIIHTCFAEGCQSEECKTRKALEAINLEKLLVEASYVRNDTGNAQHMVDYCEGNILYCDETKTWFIWSEKRWAKDRTSRIYRAAGQTVKRMAKEAFEIQIESLRKDALGWALQAGNRKRLDAMVALASRHQDVAVTADQFDADPLLFNCANGVLDLRTGELRPHRREDFISKLAPVTYDPTAQCPRWKQFLEEILPPSIVEFMQTAVGYSLSGDTLQKYLFMMIGESGDNGKTTFIEAMRKLFGDYAINMSFNSLLPRDDHGNSGDIARLAGARFVSACESNEGQKLSTTMLKRLVGGEDTITACRKYENEVEFKPTGKIWLATNYQPIVPAGDNAAWNRVLKIPFLVQIPKDRQDTTLPAVFKSELPGILNWALDGWKRFQKDGRLIVPSEVSKATKEYRDSMDLVQEWTSAYTLKGAGQALGTDLYVRFVEWSQAASGRGKAAYVMSNKKFYSELGRLGFKSDHGKRGVVFTGLTLKVKEGEMF